MKKIIAILLIVIFCTQVIPVAEIGYILCSNQLTEEFADCVEDGFSQKKFDSQLKDFFSTNTYSFFSHNQFYWHLQESLPHNHSSEISSPPPDALAA